MRPLRLFARLELRRAVSSTPVEAAVAAAAANPSTAVATPSVARLRSMYEAARKDAVSRSGVCPRVDPRAVFVNNDLDLSRIQVYGFDYDYTLAVYTRELNPLIYRLALKRLVEHYNYPRELASIPYDDSFAIRGLHFDVAKCCLLKVDAFSQIQKGTVHRGRRKLSDEEVRSLYGGFSLPDAAGRAFPQLIDLFSLPWAGLLATTVQYFDDKSIEFDPPVLYQDVADSVGHVHISGELYRTVQADMERYVHKNGGLGEYLEKLVRDERQLFMVTNSPFEFMNRGMEYMLGSGWRDLFSHVVVSAKKPAFFSGNAPFRLYDEKSGKLSYEKVTKMEKGRVYSGGNIDELSLRAGFGTKGVLYFGDHIYTDLADPMLRLGWGTAAIVPELAREIRSQNGDFYQKGIMWLETLTLLIERERTGTRGDREAEQLIHEWMDERAKIREQVKAIFNPHFGSLFRTYHQMTFFSRRLCRLADIYTSRLPNLLKYETEHAFFPRRNALPHENFNAVPTESSKMVGQIVDCHECQKGTVARPTNPIEN
ncbi:hypothetical protein PRIPAC_81911 [Pristionchus pacificus]|uniref:Uncharacterized protein n=1 Tax=Pristionchus pacificus TaxID=54126 RepID=A0A2A6BYE6_PRIPA|nr:hypothetical protein PRIPAC_81911 [Pristionchus pacificus]|eukprot:PDM70866.1 hypothetical protein PRIPAC_45070 [Pristionchus pacificus]